MNQCTINYITKKIIITKAFAKDAGKVGTPEYNELQEAMRGNPTFSVEVRTIAKKKDKVTYRNLSYENIELYITMVEQNPAAMLEQFNNVRRISMFQKGSYAFVKSWFLKTYPHYQNSFSEG